MTQHIALCTLRALRELGYYWRWGYAYDRREAWHLESRGDDLKHCDVYWNGDSHDVRLIIGSALIAEKSVELFRGPTPRAVELRARAVMATFRAMAERKVVMTPWWTVIRLGGDAKQRRKNRRWGERLIAAARAEAKEEVTP